MNKPAYSRKDDRQLISGCVSGDRQALETLVKRFTGLVYKSVHYTLLTKNVPFQNQDLEDLHNTVFMQLFENNCKKLNQYQGKNGCSLASWIKVVTVRIVLNHIRKKGMDAIGWQKRRLALDDIAELRGESEETWVIMERSEQERLLDEGIQWLAPRDKLFVKLHFERGYSVEEIAETMQLTTQNIYTLKHRVVQRIKDYVDNVS